MAADTPRLLTVVEAAEVLGVSVSQVYNLFGREDGLPKVNLSQNGKRPKIRVRTSDLVAFVDAHSSSAPAKT